MKRILITGANKGIGRAMVSAVLEHSEDTFVILGSRNLERGQSAKQALSAEQDGWSKRILVVSLDVSSDESITHAARQVREHFPEESKPLYGIVNNAGIGIGDFLLKDVLEVNVYGIHRVCQAFLPMLQSEGRVVNVTSAAGPNFVNKCSAEKQTFFLNTDVTWDEIDRLLKESIEISGNAEAFASRGLSNGSPYGLSKACANSYTLMLAKQNPQYFINACTPGFIETDLTRHYAESSGKTPAEMGMKSPKEGTYSTVHLLFNKLEGNGWYYGSDAQRSPLDRYRSPGSPPYQGS